MILSKNDPEYDAKLKAMADAGEALPAALDTMRVRRSCDFQPGLWRRSFLNVKQLQERIHSLLNVFRSVGFPIQADPDTEKVPAESAPPPGRKWQRCIGEGCFVKRAVVLDAENEYLCGTCPTPPMVFDYDDDNHWNAEEPERRSYDLRQRGQAIQCRVCGFTSHHWEDVLHKYCGRCHDFHMFLIDKQEKGKGKNA